MNPRSGTWPAVRLSGMRGNGLRSGRVDVRADLAAMVGLILIFNGFAGGVSADTLAEVSPTNILVNPSFEQGSGNSAVAWQSALRGRAQCFVAGSDKARTGSRCIATRGTFTGPGTVSGWYLSGGTVELINPVGDGTNEFLAVAAGENYLRITDDPALGWDATYARTWVTRTTIKANRMYRLRFSYGKSSFPAKTWTRMGVFLAGCPTVGSFTNCIAFANPYSVSWSGAPGWKTYEYSEKVLPGDPRIGMYIGLQLEGHTLGAANAYYFDKVEISEEPLTITTADGSGADAYLQESLPTSNFGTAHDLIAWGDPAHMYKGYVRFDLSRIGYIELASLTCTTIDGQFAPGTTLWGLIDGDAGEFWPELTTGWNNAPANDTSDATNFLPNATFLGVFENIDNVAGGTGEFSGDALKDFLNADTDGLATLMFASPNGFTYLASKDNTNGFAPPTLVVTAGPQAGMALIVL